jgi:hypothetical protein
MPHKILSQKGLKHPNKSVKIFFPILEKTIFFTVKETQVRHFICGYQQQHTKPSSKLQTELDSPAITSIDLTTMRILDEDTMTSIAILHKPPTTIRMYSCCHQCTIMGRYTQLKSGTTTTLLNKCRWSGYFFVQWPTARMVTWEWWNRRPLLQYHGYNMTLAICLFLVGDGCAHLALKTKEILLSYP